MVLNNLYYIMAKFGDEFQAEMDNIWAALCKFWPTNLKVSYSFPLPSVRYVSGTM